MPRTLPWLLGASEKKPVRSRDINPGAPQKRLSSPDDLVNSDLDSIGGDDVRSRRKNGKRPMLRSPSTSPPPPPPDVEFMREGHDADDIWMMVEDEFLSTANLFTQHLHHAEYQRMKRLARARGAETLARLDRGTDGVTEQSAELKMRQEARRKAERQKKEIRQILSAEAGESESSDADEFMQDPQLAGLMTTGSQLGGKSLGSFAKPILKESRMVIVREDEHEDDWFGDEDIARPNSPMRIDTVGRNAEQPEEDKEETDDDDDDLDSKALKKSTRPPLRSSKVGTNSVYPPSFPQKDLVNKQNAGFFKRFTKSTSDEDPPTSLLPASHTRSVKSSPTLVEAATPVKKLQILEDTSNVSLSGEVLLNAKGSTSTTERGLDKIHDGKGSRSRECLPKRRRNEETKAQDEHPRKPLKELPTFMF